MCRVSPVCQGTGRYVSCEQDFAYFHENLKHHACPFCAREGFLIRHGYVYGYDRGSPERKCRGRRFFCSNRNLRKGCGRTFSILFSHCLRRRQVNAPMLWKFVCYIAQGRSIKAAWERVTSVFSLHTGYRLWRTWRGCQFQLRSFLCRILAPPQMGEHSCPLAQVIHHLKAAFSSATCPASAYQVYFQQPLLA